MTNWNQHCYGNAWVNDGAVGFWATFAAGTTAQKVLDDYMSTADYSAATGLFQVCAVIDGDVAICTVGPGGEVQS